MAIRFEGSEGHRKTLETHKDIIDSGYRWIGNIPKKRRDVVEREQYSVRREVFLGTAFRMDGTELGDYLSLFVRDLGEDEQRI